MKKIISLFIVTALFNSCGIVNHKRLTYHQQAPQVPLSFNTNGVYYRFDEFHGGNGDDRYGAGLYFFYRDGSVIAAGITMENAADKDVLSKLTASFKSALENSKGNGGRYIIAGDSIKTQMFTSTQQRGFFSTDITEDYFVINRDANSISRVGSYCSWCPKKEKITTAETNPPVVYQFLPLTSKPDSSKIWFRKKKWYKKETGIIN